MAKWWCTIGLALVLAGCGGVDLCDCEREATLENPDQETMAACADLYQGKTFEEIEASLQDCN